SGFFILVDGENSVLPFFWHQVNIPDRSNIENDLDENDLDENNLTREWREPITNSHTLAVFQYTSGSTGKPKGVMLTHGNLLHNSALIHQCFGHSKDSQGVIWLPPYHDMGLIGGIIQPLYGGFPVTLMSPVDFLQKPYRWLQAISRYKATTSGGPNFAYDLCMHKITEEQRATLDLSSWEVAFNGAEPIRAETLEQFVAVFEPCGFRKEAFYPCYGMAESTLIISGGLKDSQPVYKTIQANRLEENRVVLTTKDNHKNLTLVSCGQTRMNQKITIADPEKLTSCSPGQVGEIWVSGQSIAQGYWNCSEQTKLNFQAYLLDSGEGPFLRTGDLGFIEDGELYITGRIKDLIIIRGRNHYPQDIEQTVQTSHPALKMGHGAAFSVEVEGNETLVITQEVKRSYLRKLNINQVVTAICQAVAQEHEIQVSGILLLKTGSIPKTSSGKIQRYACRQGFMNNTLNVVSDWTSSPRMKSEFRNLQAELNQIEQDLHTNRSPHQSLIKSDSQVNGQGNYGENIQTQRISVVKPPNSYFSQTEETQIQNISVTQIQEQNTCDNQEMLSSSHNSLEAIQNLLVVRIIDYLKANATHLNVDDIDIQKPLTTYGLDSLALIELSAQLENWLGFGLSPTTLYEYPTIKTLAEYLDSLQNQKLEAKVEELSEQQIDSVLQKLLD
ncbi:AMP-binding protein, partial [Mastigocoleus testarum]|uniref:AMP-binding protein n=1 Tax=Mastigocoleus testarum TaxID=996925 RepID=UPI000A7BE68E